MSGLARVGRTAVMVAAVRIALIPLAEPSSMSSGPPGTAELQLGPVEARVNAQVIDLRFSMALDVPDGEPVAVSVRPDGSAIVAVAPLVAHPAAFAALRFADSRGWTASRVPRDSQGRDLLPLAVVATGDASEVVATADRIVAYDGGGNVVWDRPAGDGHPDFGPSARGLAAAGDRLYGVDLANARLLGYDAGSGVLRQRLGTAGTAPGSYLAPMDVAVLSDGRRIVADHGNRRLALSDADGNPAGRWPLPERPVAVARAADDTVMAILEDDTVFVLDGRGSPIARFGRHGRGPGELRMAVDIAIGPDGRVWIADRGNRRIAIFAGAEGVATPSWLTATAAAATPTPTATATATATATSPILPSERACPGEPARFRMAVDLPPVAPRTDIVLAFDTTGSMEAVVSTARTRALDMAARLRSLAPDVAVAVVDVRDMPYGAAGQATDWPWRLRGALSTDPQALATAAGELWAGGGGDEPEAYSLVLRGVIDDPRLGWRAGARRIVALFGDSVPRDEDLNAGIASPWVPGVWAPGAPGGWRDSGPDWAPYSADDLDWQSVLLDLRDAGITLVVGVTGAAPAGVRGRVDVLTGYWRDWTARTAPGGGAVELAAARLLPEALAGLVAGTGRHIDRLVGEVEPPVFSSWVAWAPAEHVDIDVPAGGAGRVFDVTIAPPPLTPDGTYDLTLYALADGARYGERPVRLMWRGVCGPGATATPTDEATPTVAASTATQTPTAAGPAASATALTWPTATASAGATASATATATRMYARVYLPIAERLYCDPARRPVAQVVLVIDTSSSMAGAKLAAAIEAGRRFVDLINLPRDQAAVVTFDSAARVIQPLSASRAKLRSSLAELATGVGTRIDLGVGAALDVLRVARSGLGTGAGGGAGGGAGTRQIVVLLTDGRPDGGSEADVLAAGGRARAEGVTVFAVGLGEDAAGELLARVATDASLYRFAPSAVELGAVYGEIAGDVGCR